MGASETELAALYAAEYRAFVRVLMSLGRSPEAAHDAVQDGFARALERRSQFRGESLRAWVWRIVLRRLIDADRRTRGELTVADLPEHALEPRDEPDRLHDALLALPPRRRAVVFLRFYADLSYREIAECTGVAEGTVAATLSQAYAVLRKALEKEAEVRR